MTYEYLKNLKDYLSSPWSNIMKIIDEEILYNEDKKPYYFDYISYDKDYKELYHEIYENYLNEKEKFLNNLFIPNHIKNKLYIELSDFINETFINLEEKLLNLSQITSYEFLDINYNFTEMIYNTLNEIKDLYYEDIKNKIEETYNNQFEQFKNTIKI